MPPYRSLALIKSPNNHKYPRTPRSTYCWAFPGAMICSATHRWHLWSSSSRTVLLSILVISITTILITLESLITFQSTWHHHHSTPAPLTMIWLKPQDNLFFCYSSTIMNVTNHHCFHQIAFWIENHLHYIWAKISKSGKRRKSFFCNNFFKIVQKLILWRAYLQQ